MYKIKEIYFTIQGEGAQTGRPAVFCRFTGCNLWSGREEDRDKAICKFCDTDFWGTDGENGGKYDAKTLANKIDSLWPTNEDNKYIVFTGGEPALQLDTLLIDELHQLSYEIAIETNGTLSLPDGIDWICVSPKSNTNIVVSKGNELKLVFPQHENDPTQFEHLAFDHFYLQPLDDINQLENIQNTMAYCMSHPKWKLSIQTHKFLGIS